jgi:hypothetical protein
MLNNKVCGGLVKIGEKHFVHHCMTFNNLSKEEFNLPLLFITAATDELEQEFIGGDDQ